MHVFIKKNAINAKCPPLELFKVLSHKFLDPGISLHTPACHFKIVNYCMKTTWYIHNSNHYIHVYSQMKWSIE